MIPDEGLRWGFLTPVPDEIDARELPVTGTLPPELDGRFLRNGPNPRPGEVAGHPFLGQGMVHGVRLHSGRADWYRNRWVRTAAVGGKGAVRPDGTRDLTAVSANTHVIDHAGRILALVESGLPHELTPDLDTVGPVDFEGRLRTAMTAHPKPDPLTGELHLFGYGTEPPYVTYHRLDAAGDLTLSRAVAVPGPTMMHDFAITTRYVVWLDLPLTYRPELVGRTVPYQWDDNHGARIGIMAKDDPDARVRWFDVDPCYVFHVGGAYEDDAGRIVIDGVRYPPAAIAASWGRIGSPTSAAPSGAAPGLYRWTLDPARGRVDEYPLDESGGEFPTLDEPRTGRPSRYRYLATSSSEPGAITKHDLTGGAVVRHDLGDDVVAGEAVFVPATDTGSRREDDGWLLTIATRRDGTASRLLVLDAAAPERAPVAAVDLPRGVPAGFHGSWIPDSRLGPQR